MKIQCETKCKTQTSYTMSMTCTYDAHLNKSTIHWTYHLRSDCTGHIPIFEFKNNVLDRSYIYVTNYEQWTQELHTFIQSPKNQCLSHLKLRDSDGNITHESVRKASIYPHGHGVRFNVLINDGYIFTSHKYVATSLMSAKLNNLFNTLDEIYIISLMMSNQCIPYYFYVMVSLIIFVS